MNLINEPIDDSKIELPINVWRYETGTAASDPNNRERPRSADLPTYEPE
jgi:hypothetical protein